MFVRQVNAVVGAVGMADAGGFGVIVVAGCDLDHVAREGFGNAEGRVRGQHDAGAGALPTGFKGVELVFRVERGDDGRVDAGHEVFEARGLIDVADARAQAAGALGAGAVHQTAGQRPQIDHAGFASFKAARDVERYVDDRIKVRLVGDLGAQLPQLFAQDGFVKLAGGMGRVGFRLLVHLSVTLALLIS